MMKYTLEDIRSVFSQPKLLPYEANRIGIRMNQFYYGKVSAHKGINVMAQDWDNLLILDGCRFDMFRDQCGLTGRLEAKQSQGSSSWEFLSGNFGNKQFHDTIYITANPHTPKLPEETFFLTKNLLSEEWDAELKTVTPETVTEVTKSIAEEYPKKRIIVHFMQPHFPFIGSKGCKLDQRGISPGPIGSGDTNQIWVRLKDPRSDVEIDEVREAYYENLDIVLPYVSDLLEYLNGKSVVTSDHGNLLGERTAPVPARGYGHPSSLYVKNLTTVPWFVSEGGQRRDVAEGTPIDRDSLDDETANERLRALGYVD